MRPNERPEVNPIGIQNVEWDIPRINPNHFTAEEMLMVLQIDGQWEWVWLDIACIDQRWGPVAALEVGRQAQIFERAEKVTAWLSRTGGEEASFQCVYDMFNTLAQEELPVALKSWDTGKHETVLRGLAEMLSDPWFSSLWTLQEAFLSTRAEILSKNGKVWTIQRLRGSGEFRPATLLFLTRVCGEVYESSMSELQNTNGDSATQAFAFEWVNIMRERGLVAIMVQNPVGLLGAARFRTASEVEDRVYGIMQVFNYKLGSSRDPENFYGIEDLEDELGERLLEDRPWESQLHVFTKPVKRGKGWRINPTSAFRIPERFGGWSSDLYEGLVKLSSKDICGTKFGFFEGNACRLNDIRHTWRDCTVFQLMPDQSECFGDFEVADFQEWALSESRDAEDIQTHAVRFTRVCDQIAERFKQNAVIILGLSRMAPLLCGLVLIHVQCEGVMYWHRLGFCVWSHCKGSDSRTDREFSLLDASSPEWDYVKGLYG